MKTVHPVCSNCKAVVLALFSICPVCGCELKIELIVTLEEKHHEESLSYSQ